MFAPRYFAPRYFAVVYWPNGGEGEAVVAAGKGKRTYILPDGRRIRATRQEALSYLEAYRPKAEPVIPEPLPDLPALAAALPQLLGAPLPMDLAPFEVPRSAPSPVLDLRVPRDDETAIIALLLD